MALVVNEDSQRECLYSWGLGASARRCDPSGRGSEARRHGSIGAMTPHGEGQRSLELRSIVCDPTGRVQGGSAQTDLCLATGLLLARTAGAGSVVSISAARPVPVSTDVLPGPPRPDLERGCVQRVAPRGRL